MEPRVEPSINESVEAKIERFSFHGTGKEYFGIWIVNILLTIVTLGIYSAWAKVRNKKYFYGNTQLAGSAFEYTAEPMQILKGRLLAVGAFLLYNIVVAYNATIGGLIFLVILAVMPWAIMKSMAFNAHYSRYRGIAFGFRQDTKEAYKVFVLIPLSIFMPLIIGFILMSFGGGGAPAGSPFMSIGGAIAAFGGLFYVIMIPYVIYRFKLYVADNHEYGLTDFECKGTSWGAVFGIYFKAGLMLLAMTFVLGAVFALAAGVDISNLQSLENEGPPVAIYSAIAGVYLLFIIVYMVAFAYVNARTYNYFYQHTRIGSNRLRAKLNARDLLWLYFTNGAMVILSLGLLIPFAKVRIAKYRAENTALQVAGNLDDYIRGVEAEQAAYGEELGEVFDFDIGI